MKPHGTPRDYWCDGCERDTFQRRDNGIGGWVCSKCHRVSFEECPPDPVDAGRFRYWEWLLILVLGCICSGLAVWARFGP